MPHDIRSAQLGHSASGASADTLAVAALRWTTQIYLHADLAIKEQALARTKPLDAKPGRYRAPDPLLAFLEAL